MKKDKIIITVIGFAVLIVVVILAILLARSTKHVDSFESCKDAGGAILETYPLQCSLNGRTYTKPDQSTGSDNYVGLTEQAALDRAKQEKKAARVIKRDGEHLAVTMDFSPGRLNFSVKDDKVYKVSVEGE